jgi:hypothetical protein
MAKQEVNATDTAATDGFEFIYNATPVILGSRADDFIAKAGAPSDTLEVPSCAFEGIDKLLYYPGFVVNTYPIDGIDYILSVTLEDDSVETPEGVYLGMDKDEIPDVFGPAAIDANEIVYTKGGTTLTFLTEENAVIDISYYYTAALGG